MRFGDFRRRSSEILFVSISMVSSGRRGHLGYSHICFGHALLLLCDAFCFRLIGIPNVVATGRVEGTTVDPVPAVVNGFTDIGLILFFGGSPHRLFLIMQ